MSWSSDHPPPYEDLFPTRESQATLPPDYQLLQRFNRDPPYNATYLEKYKDWPEGAGYYRGELDWKGRRAGEGGMLWTGKEEVVMYCGRWEKDRMEGEGTMWWGDTGNIYHGQWVGGEMHGSGHIKYGLGSEQAGGTVTCTFR